MNVVELEKNGVDTYNKMKNCFNCRFLFEVYGNGFYEAEIRCNARDDELEISDMDKPICDKWEIDNE